MDSENRRTDGVVHLTYTDIERIMYHMGWEPEDADILWDCASQLNKHGAL